MTDLEKMCQKMEKIAKDFGFVNITSITLTSPVNELVGIQNNYIAQTIYNRKPANL